MTNLKARERRILRFFNLTIPEWKKIEAHQSGCCAICGKPAKLGKNLNTDHSHLSGLIRGLLCTKCNRLLGRIESQWGPGVVQVVAILMSVINYLNDPPAPKALNKPVYTFAGRLGTKRHLKELRRQKKRQKNMVQSKPLVEAEKECH